MYMRGSTRSSTLGLPIAGSAPLAPASALRASPARASQASPGQDSEGRSGNRGRLVPALPSHAHLDVRECELCHADTPSLVANDLGLYHIRR